MQPSPPDSPADGAASPEPTAVHYAPRRPFWESRAVRTGALFTALAVCGVIILAVVRQHIGTEPFVVGLVLAVVPVPLIAWAYLWLDHVRPGPWQSVVFAFSWGACAATLVAIFANEYGAKLLASTFSATPTQSDHWGATFVAPLVEESAKGTAVLLLFLFRRRQFGSIVDGLVLSGLTATGFAFTENILYLGSAFSEDKALGTDGVSTTFATFVVRVVMTPFAHPLFTSMTGIGFALAAILRPGRRWRWRWTPPLAGWLLAMVLHGTWNGTAQLSPVGFLTVYSVVMVPAFGLVLWLAFWARSNELRTIRDQLPMYAAAGWLPPGEPYALASMRIRGEARREARRLQGEAAGRAVRDYIAFATHLAFLRAAATRGAPEPDFAAREAELLAHLWHRKSWAQPALAHAALPDTLPRFWPAQLAPYPGPFAKRYGVPQQFRPTPARWGPPAPGPAYPGRTYALPGSPGPGLSAPGHAVPGPQQPPGLIPNAAGGPYGPTHDPFAPPRDPSTPHDPFAPPTAENR